MIEAFMLPILLALLCVLAYILWKGEREARWGDGEELASRARIREELADIYRKRPEMICDIWRMTNGEHDESR